MSKYAFGVDVGGTTVKLGLFNDKGQVLDKWEIPTVKDNGGEKVLPDIAASIKNKMQEKNISVEELVGVGIGAPGAVDADGYMVNGAVNIGWGAFDLAETLKKELDLPFVINARTIATTGGINDQKVAYTAGVPASSSAAARTVTGHARTNIITAAKRTDNFLQLYFIIDFLPLFS